MSDKILPIRRLKNEIRRGERKISIHGIGFVGTSIATVWLRVKAHILAVDRNPVVIQAIDDGKSPTGEPSSDEAFSNGIIEKRLITTDTSDCGDCIQTQPESKDQNLRESFWSDF